MSIFVLSAGQMCDHVMRTGRRGARRKDGATVTLLQEWLLSLTGSIVSHSGIHLATLCPASGPPRHRCRCDWDAMRLCLLHFQWLQNLLEHLFWPCFRCGCGAVRPQCGSASPGGSTACPLLLSAASGQAAQLPP